MAEALSCKKESHSCIGHAYYNSKQGNVGIWRTKCCQVSLVPSPQSLRGERSGDIGAVCWFTRDCLCHVILTCPARHAMLHAQIAHVRTRTTPYTAPIAGDCLQL